MPKNKPENGELTEETLLHEFNRGFEEGLRQATPVKMKTQQQIDAYREVQGKMKRLRKTEWRGLVGARLEKWLEKELKALEAKG